MKQRNIPFFYLAGSTSAQERKREVKEFNRGEVKVFLISLKAGGTGLNLTGADTVIHFDPWWNPAVRIRQRIVRTALDKRRKYK